MAQWFRQHHESLLRKMLWHVEDPRPTEAAVFLGLRLAVCGTTMAAEDCGVAFVRTGTDLLLLRHTYSAQTGATSRRSCQDVASSEPMMASNSSLASGLATNVTTATLSPSGT
jgi:hypothetical protein